MVGTRQSEGEDANAHAEASQIGHSMQSLTCTSNFVTRDTWCVVRRIRKQPYHQLRLLTAKLWIAGKHAYAATASHQRSGNIGVHLHDGSEHGEGSIFSVFARTEPRTRITLAMQCIPTITACTKSMYIVF